MRRRQRPQQLEARAKQLAHIAVGASPGGGEGEAVDAVGCHEPHALGDDAAGRVADKRRMLTPHQVKDGQAVLGQSVNRYRLRAPAARCNAALVKRDDALADTQRRYHRFPERGRATKAADEHEIWAAARDAIAQPCSVRAVQRKAQGGPRRWQHRRWDRPAPQPRGILRAASRFIIATDRPKRKAASSMPFRALHGGDRLRQLLAKRGGKTSRCRPMVYNGRLLAVSMTQPSMMRVR